MPGDSTARPVARTAQTPSAKPSVTSASSSIGARKGAATRVRHAAERRAALLREIDDQIAGGTLTVRHMTQDQQVAAAETVRRIRAGGTGAVAGERI